MLDHHQFLFLLRLAESVQSIGEKVYQDTDAIFSERSELENTLNTVYEAVWNNMAVAFCVINGRTTQISGHIANRIVWIFQY